MAPMPRTPQTAEQLQNTAELLIELSAALSKESSKVDQHDLESVDVRNFDQCRRALEYLENYISAVRSAIHEKRESRGDFGPATVSGAPAKSPKKTGTKQHRSGHRDKSPDTKKES